MGRSRGFGFATFQSADQAQAVLQGLDRYTNHVIDGKTVECRLCEPKGSAPPPMVQPPASAHQALLQRDVGQDELQEQFQEKDRQQQQAQLLREYEQLLSQQQASETSGSFGSRS